MPGRAVSASAWDGIFTLASPAFRKAFDAAELNFDLHALCFDGPQETLNQTQYTQPCMVAFGLRRDGGAGSTRAFVRITLQD